MTAFIYYSSSIQTISPEDPGAFLAAAIGGKVLVPLTRPNFIYVGLDRGPVCVHG